MTDKKLVIITGASEGIGKEFAIQLVKKGWFVCLLARRTELLKKICIELNGVDGENATYFTCDVSQYKQMKDVVTVITKKYHKIDLLIANAGIGKKAYVENFKVSSISNVYQVNVFGVLSMLEFCLPHMLSRKSGQIVVVSSLASYTSFPRMHPYCASKAALNKHLEGIRLELKPHNIFVTTLCPGFIRTSMTKYNRFPMPFVMSKEKAVKKMLGAVFRRQNVYNFPLVLYLLTKLYNVLPRFTRAVSK